MFETCVKGLILPLRAAFFVGKMGVYEWRWTGSIAVDSQNLIEETKTRLGFKAKGRRMEGHPEESCVLREESVPYNADFAIGNEGLIAENTFFWDDSLTGSEG